MRIFASESPLRRRKISMNNQFSQKVSDIIVYSKEEANRLKSSYIGPEHLLLGMLRDGEGKAIEILSKLKTNLTDIKKQIEAILKEHADDMLLPDADVPLSNGIWQQRFLKRIM